MMIHYVRARLRGRSRCGVVPVLLMDIPPPHVSALFTALTARGAGDRVAMWAAEAELLGMALERGLDSFTLELEAAAADRLVRALPNAMREEAERALCVDIRRHVSRPYVFATMVEAWGSA